MKIVVTKDGPYQVTGTVPLAEQIIRTDADGEPWEWVEGRAHRSLESYRLCRCGHSANKPFCDESHRRVEFDGTETASRAPYVERAETIEGPEMSMTDVPELCALARFCHPHGDVWHLIERTDDPKARELVEHETERCPSGRLVARHRASGRVVEPDLPPSIGLVQDPPKSVSGPLWVRGGIPIESADGTPYETRNRVTLCRCGQSRTKPFCDGSHISAGFRDDR